MILSFACIKLNFPVSRLEIYSLMNFVRMGLYCTDQSTCLNAGCAYERDRSAPSLKHCGHRSSNVTAVGPTDDIFPRSFDTT